VTLDKPDGWITFDISSEPNPEGDGLQVQFLATILSTDFLNFKQSGLCVCASNNCCRKPHEWQGHPCERPPCPGTSRVSFVSFNSIALDSINHVPGMLHVSMRNFRSILNSSKCMRPFGDAGYIVCFTTIYYYPINQNCTLHLRKSLFSITFPREADMMCYGV
jgi:hypothetical protein